MSLADLLGDLGRSLSAAPERTNPMEFTQQAMQMGGPGGFSNVDTPYGGGAVAQQAPEQAPKKRGGLGDFLGKLGDAILIGAGGEPIYRKKVEREKLGEALSQFIGTQDPRLAAFVRDNPEQFATLYNAQREDKRFERAAGQDDRRIGISEGQLDLGKEELGERKRSNMAGEGITTRGQNLTATTQVRLQQMRAGEQRAQQQFDAAMRSGDRVHAEKMAQLQHRFQREIKALEGNGAYEETVVETPGTEASDGWFSDTPATPSTKTVTRRPLSRSAEPAGGVSQADLEFTAKKHGISVDEVKRRLAGQK